MQNLDISIYYFKSSNEKTITKQFSLWGRVKVSYSLLPYQQKQNFEIYYRDRFKTDIQN